MPTEPTSWPISISLTRKQHEQVCGMAAKRNLTEGRMLKKLVAKTLEAQKIAKESGLIS